MVNPRFVIKAVLSGQRLNINVPLTVAGTVNYIGVEAKCTSEWDDCTVVCYLHQADTGYTAQLGLIYDAERKLYYFPNAERLTLTAGEWAVWFVGVMAESGQETYRVTSDTRYFSVYPNPFASSIPPGDISLDEEAIARATDAQNKANLLLDKYNAGELTGPQGEPGDPAEIGFVQASVDNTTGNPGCVVTVTENPENTYNMQFAFSGIKGAKGDTGATGPKGDTGAQGAPGRDGTDGRDGVDGETIDDYVLVQAEQPTSETNKMWLKPTASAQPVMMPTADELYIVANTVDNLNKNAENINLPAPSVGAGYIRYEDGEITDSTSSSHTDYIDVSGYKKLLYKRVKTSAANPPSGMAFYKEDKSYDSGQRAVPYGSTAYMTGLQEIAVPATAKYARFTTFIDEVSRGTFELYGIIETIYHEKNNTAALNVEDQSLLYNLYDGYLNDQGVIATDSYNSKFTDYVKVAPGEKITIKITNPDNKNIYLAVCERDSGYAFIRRFAILTYTPAWRKDSYLETPYTVPNGVSYVAFTYRTYNTITAEIVRLITNIGPTVENNEHTNNIKPHTKVRSINHRGWYECPENTITAYKQSALHGFDYVETDVRLTSDGVPVLLHDATINNTARNADGTEISDTINIADITYAQALQYDFGVYKGSQYAGEKIATLDELLTLCRNTGMRPYVELQSVTNTVEAITIIANVVKDSAIADEVTFVSNYIEALVKMRDLLPYNRYGLSPFTYTRQYLIGANALKNGKAEVFFSLAHTQITANVISTMKEKGYPLETWVADQYVILSSDKYISGFTSNDAVASNVLFTASTT